MNRKVQLAITAAALMLVLVYNFVHTGSLLASYVSPPHIGYLAAAGIELAVVGLSLQIGQRKQRNEDAGFFYFVLVSVVVVSALANMSQGHLQRYATHISLATVTSIDILQGVVGIAATALLSLVVMALAEIVGQMQRHDDNGASNGNAQPAQRTGPTKTEQVIALADAQPELTTRQLAAKVGCSLSTANRALMIHKRKESDHANL